MNRKSLLRKLMWFVSIVAAVFLYLGFFFFPTIKSINRIKREIQETQVRIDDFQKMENRFVFSDENERKYFESKDAALEERFPEISEHQELVKIFDRFSDHIYKTGKSDGIGNLLIMSTSRALMIKKNLMVSDDVSFKLLEDFSGSRFREVLEKEQSKNGQSVTSAGVFGILSTFIIQLKYQIVCVGFSGRLRNAGHFLNHIPWLYYYIGIDNVTVDAAEGYPLFVVMAKIYYLDKKAPIRTGGQTLRKTDTESSSFLVDFHSEVLLNPVSSYLPRPYTRQEIPQTFREGIFKIHGGMR